MKPTPSMVSRSEFAVQGVPPTGSLSAAGGRASKARAALIEADDRIRHRGLANPDEWIGDVTLLRRAGAARLLRHESDRPDLAGVGDRRTAPFRGMKIRLGGSVRARP
jgi:hypothetical protein